MSNQHQVNAMALIGAHQDQQRAKKRGLIHESGDKKGKTSKLSNFDFLKKVGKGAYSSVWKVRRK